LIVECDKTFERHRVEIYVNEILWWEDETGCEPEERSGYRPEAHRFEAPLFIPPDTGLLAFRAVVQGSPATSEPDKSIDQKTLRALVMPGDLMALAIKFDGREPWPIKWDVYPPNPTGKPLPPDTISVNTSVSIESASWIRGTYKGVQVVIDRDGVVLLDEPHTFRPACHWPTPLKEHQTVVWTPAQAGDYTFTLTLNPDHRLRETNHINNVVSRVLTVTP
jgi:hypothetical protein